MMPDDTPTSATTRTGSALRPPLTRERVLLAAIQLADTAGIDALTMRRLGQELGVEAMSLYNHVANKDDILAGMVELVHGEIALPEGHDWKAALRRSAISAHEVAWRHPWAHGVSIVLEAMSAARLRWAEAVLRTLREAGFSPELTCHAYHALESHITGFTLWAGAFPDAGRLRELAADFLQQLPVEQFPYFAEHIEQHLIGTHDGDEGEFEFGLDLLLDGLERLRDGPRSARLAGR